MIEQDPEITLQKVTMIEQDPEITLQKSDLGMPNSKERQHMDRRK